MEPDILENNLLMLTNCTHIEIAMNAILHGNT